MKEMVFEVVTGVIILTLLISVIALFRGNMDVINQTAIKRYNIEKIQTKNLIPLKQEQCTGADMVASIRYYSNNPSIEVIVTIGTITKTYVTETFENSHWEESNIYEAIFNVQIEYSGSEIKRIYYTIQS